MGKVKILIVEDCIITAKTIKKSLLTLGYEVMDIVKSGEEAISLCFANKPDLILMDIELDGELNGIETANIIRLSFDIPTIYLTSLSDEETLKQAKISGGFAYLIKPFRTEDLYANIEIITYAHEMKKKAWENEIKYKNIFENMFDGFAYCKIVFDDNNRPVEYIFLEVNESFEKITGFNKDDVIGKSVKDTIKLNEGDKLYYAANYLEELTLGQKKFYIGEHYIELTNKWVNINISCPQKGYLSALLTDITERKISDEKMKYLTYYDKLTGLYNRAYFEEELKRYDNERELPLSIIIGDVNGLKLANDVFGHNEGDRLLKRIANKIKKCCRKSDLVARWGGDEFVILLPRTNEEITKRICERIMNSCQMDKGDSLIKGSISLGCTTKNNPSENMSQLFKEAEKRMYKNKLIASKNAHEKIIKSLKNTLIKRTNENKEHMEMVKDISISIAKKLSLPEKILKELELLAIFHDIGKISIPDNIINRPDLLTQDEWDIIKQHPMTGYRIASSSTYLMEIAEAILFHHERWDGKGYPMGISGKEIPITSRIIAIAETYDVLTNGRNYREPLSHDEAIKEIKKAAGTQFDPYLVDIFLEVMDIYKMAH